MAGKARLLCSNLPAHMCTVPLDITCNRLSATPELPRGKTHPAQVTDKLCTERNRRRALAERRTLPGAPARDRLTVMGVDKQASASGLKRKQHSPVARGTVTRRILRDLQLMCPTFAPDEIPNRLY